LSEFIRHTQLLPILLRSEDFQNPRYGAMQRVAFLKQLNISSLRVIQSPNRFGVPLPPINWQYPAPN
ncbi:MAG: hypothetical protein WA004_16420, partial [Saprospiraceae bacterium]